VRRISSWLQPLFSAPRTRPPRRLPQHSRRARRLSATSVVRPGTAAGNGYLQRCATDAFAGWGSCDLRHSVSAVGAGNDMETTG